MRKNVKNKQNKLERFGTWKVNAGTDTGTYRKQLAE